MRSMTSTLSIALLLTAIGACAFGQPISTIGTVVTDGPGPKLYDIRSNGSLVNPRSISWSGLTTFSFIGLTENGSGGFVSVTHPFSGSTAARHVFGMSSGGGASLSSGPFPGGLTFDEGGVARNPSTGVLWAVSSGGDIYSFPSGVPTYEFSLSVTSLGVGTSGCAGMAFSPGGDLFVLALGGGGQIFQIDPVGVSLIGWTTISATVVPGDGGMDFNISNPNELFVVAPVFNGATISQRLLRVNHVTNSTTDLGATTLSTINGLVINRPFGGLTGTTAHVELQTILDPNGAGGGIPVGDVLRAKAGDEAAILLHPRSNRLVGTLAYLFLQGMPNGQLPRPNPFFPAIHLDFFGPVQPTPIINGALLPQAGLGFSFRTPPGLANTSYVLQAALLGANLPQGFETTRAIEVHFD